jgi:PhnB protein
MKSVIPILAVRSIESSLPFYNDVLGFATAFTLPGEDGKLIHASVRRGSSELMLGRLADADGERLGTGVILYMMVDEDEDIDAFFERARAAGAKVVQEPTDQFWGHRDWGIADPDGYQLFVSKETRQVSMEELASQGLALTTAD